MITDQQNPYYRIFCLLYILRTDYSELVHEGKVKIKALKDAGRIPKAGNKKGQETKIERNYFADLKFHQALVNEINRLHIATEHKHQATIETEMNSERIKDLHEFMDNILLVQNIGILSEVIRIGLKKPDSELMFLTVDENDHDAIESTIKEYKLLIEDSRADIANYETKIEELKAKAGK